MANQKIQLKNSTGSDNLYPVTRPEYVENTSGTTLDTLLNDATNDINVSAIYPTDGTDSGNTYSLTNAIAKVPSDLRKIGVRVTFISDGSDSELKSGAVYTYEYIGVDPTYTGKWRRVDNFSVQDAKSIGASAALEVFGSHTESYKANKYSYNQIGSLYHLKANTRYTVTVNAPDNNGTLYCRLYAEDGTSLGNKSITSTSGTLTYTPSEDVNVYMGYGYAESQTITVTITCNGLDSRVYDAEELLFEDATEYTATARGWIRYTTGAYTGSGVFTAYSFNVVEMGIKAFRVNVVAADTVPAAIAYYSGDTISTDTYLAEDSVQMLKKSSDEIYISKVPDNAVLAVVTNRTSTLANPTIQVCYHSGSLTEINEYLFGEYTEESLGTIVTEGSSSAQNTAFDIKAGDVIKFVISNYDTPQQPFVRIGFYDYDGNNHYIDRATKNGIVYGVAYEDAGVIRVYCETADVTINVSRIKAGIKVLEPVDFNERLVSETTENIVTTFMGVYSYDIKSYTNNRMATDAYPTHIDETITLTIDSENGWQAAVVALKDGMVIADSSWKTTTYTVKDWLYNADHFAIAVRRVVDDTQMTFSAEDLGEQSAVTLTRTRGFKRYAHKDDIEGVQKQVDTIQSEIDAIDTGALSVTPDIYNIFKNTGVFYHHLWIDKLQSSSQFIPSQSLFDVASAARLGFKVMELNTQFTSDNVPVTCHGVSGNLGAGFINIDGTTTGEDVAFSSLTLAELQSNWKYRSSYPKYQGAVPTLEQMLYECKKYGIIPFVGNASNTLVYTLCNKICGNNWIAYAGSRSTTKGMVMTWSGLTDPDDIAARCEEVGAPYMHAFSTTALTTIIANNQLQECIDAVHNKGCLCAIASSYQTNIQTEEWLNMGIDCAASGWQVNDFVGNLYNLDDGNDFDDFTTTGTVSDGILTLASGQTLSTPITDTLWLGKVSLKIIFEGSLTITMGRKYNHTFTSDGKRVVWLSTVISENEIPTFTATATDSTQVKMCSFAVSKC